MNYRYWPFLIGLLLLLGACRTQKSLAEPTPAEIGTYQFERFQMKEVQRPEKAAFGINRQPDPADYYPDTLNPSHLPYKYVKLNFHVMNSTDTLFDFYGKKALDYVESMMSYSNRKLGKNPKMWLMPDSMDVPVVPTHLRLVLANKPGTDEPAVYEHFDDELYGYIHKGKDRNRANRAVIEKYGVNLKTELNVFLMGPPREKLADPNFKASSTSGIFLGNGIKLTDMLSKDVPPWTMRQVFTHEVGHALGLGHAWTKNDGCADTPKHANSSWRAKERGPGKTSNNLMDYSPNQEALTPCQIGKMHAALSDPNSKARGWAVARWCKYRPHQPVSVSSTVVWNGNRDFESDIVVEPGASLTINGRIHLPAGASIKVAPTAQLILGPEAILHNACGDEWAGIRVGVSEKGLRGIVEADPLATILNEKG